MTFRWIDQIHADFTSNTALQTEYFRYFRIIERLSFYYLCYFRDKVINYEVCVHIKYVSKSVTQLDSFRKACSWYCGSFGFLRLRANGRNNSQHCCANNVGSWLRACWQWCANGCNNSQQVWDLQCIVGRIQCWKNRAETDPTLLPYASAITEQKKCWELLAEKFDRFQTLQNNKQQHPTTCNRVCKRTHHVTSNNVASVCMGLKWTSFYCKRAKKGLCKNCRRIWTRYPTIASCTCWCNKALKKAVKNRVLYHGNHGNRGPMISL